MQRSSDMARLHQRIIHTARPARQSNVPDETGNISRVQAKFNDVDVRDLNHMQLTGFASATPKDTDLMILNVGGDNSNGVVIATNHQTYRPKNLQTGEVCLYDCQGDNSHQQSILLKADGSIVLTGYHNVTINCDTAVTITAPTVTINGDLHVTGAVIAGYGTGDSVTVQQHRHGTSGSSASSTVPPTAGT